MRRARKGEPMAWLKANVGHTGSECLTWPFMRSWGGYGIVNFPDGVRKSPARVMCEMVHGDPPTERHQVAHSCGKGGDGCCNPNHLRWATPKENCADKRRHGTNSNKRVGGPIDEIIKACGGVARLKKELGRKNPDFASKWRQHGIPDKAWFAVTRLSGIDATGIFAANRAIGRYDEPAA